MHRTLIDTSTLAGHLHDPDWAIVDCRFDILDAARGAEQYIEAHIPGARYADLDKHLSGPKTGTNGRHPLPGSDALRRDLGLLGIGPATQVVAYDADSSTYAARLWWLLRWMGHEAVAVLDGGYARWCREGYPVRDGTEPFSAANFNGAPREGSSLTVLDVMNGLHLPTRLLVDSRSNDRYHGINETIDRTGGHIPGATNYFFMQNMTPEKTFKTPEELNAKWASLLNGRDPGELVVYCGSGVTACNNLLALEHAGLSGARLYPGSWSEWSADPARPIATDER